MSPTGRASVSRVHPLAPIGTVEGPAGARPVVPMLLGPTAAGKTGLALALARHFDAEIVCVDSATVYRGMDAGTAKPSRAEQAEVPHHLIDLLSPLERYSAARFRSDALASIADIHRRGRRAILVGGTMLYAKALLDGLDELPQADPALRAELDARAAVEGWPALHAELARHDPATAARLKPTDAQRVQRALEVWRLTGQSLSALHGAVPRLPLPFRPLVVSLSPSDRAALHARIAARFDAMLEAGLVDELQALRRDLPTLSRELPSMRCVGYRQAWEWLEGEVSHAEFRNRGVAATRQLAKRQLTWLRVLPADCSLDCLRADLEAAVLALVEPTLAPPRSV